MVSKFSVSPSPTVFPSLVHVIFRVGFPVATQWKDVTNLPSVIILAVGLATILGETKKNDLEKYKANGTFWSQVKICASSKIERKSTFHFQYFLTFST